MSLTILCLFFVILDGTFSLIHSKLADFLFVAFMANPWLFFSDRGTVLLLHDVVTPI